jgi:predicted transcriptional regulator
MGLRHLVVVDSRNRVRGMITRGDLLESSLKKLH